MDDVDCEKVKGFVVSITKHEEEEEGDEINEITLMT